MIWKLSRDRSELNHWLTYLRGCNISLIRGTISFSKVNQTPYDFGTSKPQQSDVQRSHSKGSWLWESPSENISWLFSQLKAFLGFRNRFRVIHSLSLLPESLTHPLSSQSFSVPFSTLNESDVDVSYVIWEWREKDEWKPMNPTILLL